MRAFAVVMLLLAAIGQAQAQGESLRNWVCQDDHMLVCGGQELNKCWCAPTICTKPGWIGRGGKCIPPPGWVEPTFWSLFATVEVGEEAVIVTNIESEQACQRMVESVMRDMVPFKIKSARCSK